MTFRSIVFLACLLGVDSAAATDARPHAPTPSPETEAHAQAAGRPPADEFSLLDTNHDGVLSKAELSRHPKAAHMAMVDENGDGVLSREEFAELSGM